MIGISQRIYFGGTNRSNNGRFGLLDWLHLAATPTFALLALLTTVSGSDPTTCMGMAGSLPLESMGFMYLLMGVFHAAPWVRLLPAAGWRSRMVEPGWNRVGLLSNGRLRKLTVAQGPARNSFPQSVQRLAASEARVTDVAGEFPISLNSVSKHIRLLERARLIEREVSGREHILRFRPEPLSEAQQWIAAQQAFWASRLQALDDLLTAEDASSEILPPSRTGKRVLMQEPAPKRRI